MAVGGIYDCILHTPLGQKKGVLEIVPSGDGATFSGTLNNALMGAIDIENGTIDGDTLSCTMSMTSPMPMKVDCQVSVEGDRLNGAVNAGPFGSMKLSGQRQG